MKEMKKIALAAVVMIMVTISSVSADDAFLWGAFNDVDGNYVGGVVSTVSNIYEDTTMAFGVYVLYFPAGTYTITGTAKGYKEQVYQLTVSEDETCKLDFIFEAE